MGRGLKAVRQRRDDVLSRVGWERLEHLLAVHYRQQGYEVEHVGTGGSGQRFDGGIDLKLRKDDAYILVQCKHWNAFQVTHNAVHELLGLMVNEAASGAILVSSGEFTQAARSAAQRQGHVRLIDGDELRSMLGPDALQSPAETPHRIEALVGALIASRRVATTTRVRESPPVDSGASGAWLALSAVGLVLFVLLIHTLLKRTEGTAGPASSPVAVDVAVEHVQDEPSSAIAPAPAMPAEAANCHEVIDHFSGTYIDHCSSGERPRQPTAAEVREQQRLADEAMKVIEVNTPEM